MNKAYTIFIFSLLINYSTLTNISLRSEDRVINGSLFLIDRGQEVIDIRRSGNFFKGSYPPYTINPIVLGSLMGSEKRIITAYSSTIDQTDDTPFITASSQRVRKGIIACNDLSFGTKVEIEGLGMFEVQDRKNSRYVNGEIDIWMETREEALEFGIQERVVWVYE